MVLRKRLTGLQAYKRVRALVVAGWSAITGAAGLEVRRLPRSIAGGTNVRLKMGLEYVAARIMLDTERPSFIYIGAFDGRSNDPVHDLVTQHGWTGVLVEPNPRSFSSLCSLYEGTEGLTFLNVGVARDPGSRTFYTVREDIANAPPWVQQLASFDKRVVLSHIGHVPGLAGAIEESAVECVTLGDVFAAVPNPRVDLLQIDAEGYDAEILGMLELGESAPRIVRFEHLHMTTAQHNRCVARLRDAGYKICVEKQDTLAFRENPAAANRGLVAEGAPQVPGVPSSA